MRNTLVLRALRARFTVNERTSSARSYARRYLALTSSLARRNDPHDVAFAGFFGQPLAIALRLRQSKPVVLDAFISAYDTLCFDRRQFGPYSAPGRLAYALDLLACRSASVITVDTRVQADYFAGTFRVPPVKLRTLYLGFDPRVFHPAHPKDRDPDRFLVFHYGSYLPVHGVKYVVDAARLLDRERAIRFQLVGRGPTYARIRELVARYRLENIEFVDWIPYSELPAAIACADVCLGGHFSASGKAQRTIAGKTYQFLAVGRPTIVGDNPANRELFTPGVHAEFCPPANGEALAEAILRLYRDADRREKLANQGGALVWDRFAHERVADDWEQTLRSAMGHHADGGFPSAPIQNDPPLPPN